MSALVTRGKPGPSPKYASLADAIEANISRIPFSGCWIWMASTNRGYGQLTHGGKKYQAHRASLLAFNGVTARLACHHCDVRECVNPDHLYAGDYTTNRKDMLARSRWSHPYRDRTHCFAGHEYTDGSYYLSKSDGSRVCRTCQRDAKRKQRSKT